MLRLKRLWVLLGMILAVVVVFALPAMAQVDGELEEETVKVVFDLAWIGAIIAFFLPFLTNFLKGANWSTKAKQIFALITAAIAGVVNTGIQNGWTFDDPAQFVSLAVFSVTEVYVAASVIYNNLLDGRAPMVALENVKTLG